MIVVEGADCVGKTTLVAKLIKRLNQAGFPHVPLHLSKLPECFDHVRDYLPLMSPNVVWDRFYMSRNAYGMAVDNQRVLNRREYRYLDAKARLVPTHHVVITATPQLIRERFEDGAHMSYTIDDILRVNDKYVEFCESGWMDVDTHIQVSVLEPHVNDYVWTLIDWYLNFRRAHQHA